MICSFYLAPLALFSLALDLLVPQAAKHLLLLSGFSFLLDPLAVSFSLLLGLRTSRGPAQLGRLAIRVAPAPAAASCIRLVPAVGAFGPGAPLVSARLFALASEDLFLDGLFFFFGSIWGFDTLIRSFSLPRPASLALSVQNLPVKRETRSHGYISRFLVCRAT